MDHAFLWCATSVVAKLTLKNNYTENSEHKVSAIKTAIHENKYEYDILIDDNRYEFKYTFDSNTFARGKLDITQNDIPFKTLAIKKDMNGFKVYLSATEYIEFYTFNHRQLLGIRLVNGRKTTVASININTDRLDEEHEDYTIHITPAVPSILNENDVQLRMILFAVNGVSNKDFHHCYDVIEFKSKNISLIIFSDVTGQVICTDAKLKKIHDEQWGQITVINSDFNQTYDYVYNKSKRVYFVEERVENRHNTSVLKDRLSYREKKGIAYINEEKRYTASVCDDNDIIFEKI